MQIKSVTVTYGLTESMGGYNNVRPQISLTAELEEFDEVDAMNELMEMARERCEALVDEALEANGERPKYWSGPRFSVWRACEFIIVGPSDGLPAGWPTAETEDQYRDYPHYYNCLYSNRRFDPALALAAEWIQDHEPAGYQLLHVGEDGALPDHVVMALTHGTCRKCGEAFPWEEHGRTYQYNPVCRACYEEIAAGLPENRTPLVDESDDLLDEGEFYEDELDDDELDEDELDEDELDYADYGDSF
jgi:hypothetical protein